MHSCPKTCSMTAFQPHLWKWVHSEPACTHASHWAPGPANASTRSVVAPGALATTVTGEVVMAPDRCNHCARRLAVMKGPCGLGSVAATLQYERDRLRVRA